MFITIAMQAGLLAAAITAMAGLLTYRSYKERLSQNAYLMDIAEDISEEEAQRLEEERQRQEEEERLLADRALSCDFRIVHGSAFGGCAATLPSGKRRRGKIPLDQIMMHGRHPSGKEFTYYIEDQGIEICAADEPATLLVRSTEYPFEIREDGFGRDSGVQTMQALIRQDILYYIILENKHEISIRASRPC